MDQSGWEITPEHFLDMLKSNDNLNCVDCNSANPVWASLGFGTIVCLNCAGHHRSLGTHITLVKSIKLDSWTSEQVRHIVLSGNTHFKTYIQSLHDVGDVTDKVKKYSIPEVLYFK